MNNTTMDISELVGNARYSHILNKLVMELNGVVILRFEFEADYQGFVDIDVLLLDGRVFSYKYSYGSCSGCDEWESRDLSDDDIMDEMHKDASFYISIQSYLKYLARKDK